jgi:hypothetical protein
VEGREKLLQINDLRTFLQGKWHLERRLQDRRAGQQGRLTGSAAFTAEGAGLLYREEGQLVIGGYAGPALQAYRYGFTTPGRAAVHFSDGRFFHDLDLTAGRWTATHLCAPDRYDGDFTVLDAAAWRVIWHVTGPRKDLMLDSRYCRAL